MDRNTTEDSFTLDIQPEKTLEEKYYMIQLRKVFNDLMELQSLSNKNFVYYITICIISLTVGVALSISDKNSMASLSSKILSTSISGIGGTTTLFANIFSLKKFFTRKKLDTVDKLNKEEQEYKSDAIDILDKEQVNKSNTIDISNNEQESDIPRRYSSWNLERRKIDIIIGYEKKDREQFYFMKKLFKNAEITFIVASIWIIIFSCLMIYLAIYSIATLANEASENDEYYKTYKDLSNCLFIFSVISIIFSLTYIYQIKIRTPKIVEKKKVYYESKIPLSYLNLDETIQFYHYLNIFMKGFYIIILGSIGFITSKKDKNGNEKILTVRRIVLNQTEMESIKRLLHGLPPIPNS
ncbi:21502_t:CDS:1 [Cetraspora pellucida]|uniref:21502_t:CDS:1 n=1 Tax=Cetraspora pellucida TaxID=1433469 RepID=A0A9N9JWC8_9GLOM|nr:21502_t:CDS:1 [Cetraspora pellucida]